MPGLDVFLDEELLILISNNQRDAFHVIYDRYKLAMMAYAAKRVPLEVAEDLVHDVFISLWNNREKIDFSDRFSGYLFKSLRNAILDFIAKNKREQVYIDSLTEFALSFSYEKADDKLREELFLKGILMLLADFSPQYLTIFELRYQGYTNPEIAEKLGLSEKTIRNKYAILTKYLKNKLPLLLLLIYGL